MKYGFINWIKKVTGYFLNKTFVKGVTLQERLYVDYKKNLTFLLGIFLCKEIIILMFHLPRIIGEWSDEITGIFKYQFLFNLFFLY